MFPRAVPLKFENINKKNDFLRISSNTKGEKVHYFFVYINVLLIFLGNESYLNFFSLAIDCFHHKNLKFASFLFQMAFTRNVKENDHGFSVFPKQIKINYVFSLPFCCLTLLSNREGPVFVLSNTRSKPKIIQKVNKISVRTVTTSKHQNLFFSVSKFGLLIKYIAFCFILCLNEF